MWQWRPGDSGTGQLLVPVSSVVVRHQQCERQHSCSRANHKVQKRCSSLGIFHPMCACYPALTWRKPPSMIIDRIPDEDKQNGKSGILFKLKVHVCRQDLPVCRYGFNTTGDSGVRKQPYHDSWPDSSASRHPAMSAPGLPLLCAVVSQSPARPLPTPEDVSVAFSFLVRQALSSNFWFLKELIKSMLKMFYAFSFKLWMTGPKVMARFNWHLNIICFCCIKHKVRS